MYTYTYLHVPSPSSLRSFSSCCAILCRSSCWACAECSLKTRVRNDVSMWKWELGSLGMVGRNSNSCRSWKRYHRDSSTIGIKLLPVMWVHICIPRHIHCSCSTAMGQRSIDVCIPVTKLVSCAFSPIPICPFLIQRIFRLLVSTLVFSQLTCFHNTAIVVTCQVSCLLVLRLLSYASSRRRRKRRKHGQNGKTT